MRKMMVEYIIDDDDYIVGYRIQPRPCLSHLDCPADKNEGLSVGSNFPSNGDTAYAVLPSMSELYKELEYDDSYPPHKIWNRRGLLCKTKVDAVRMAYQIVSMAGGVV